MGCICRTKCRTADKYHTQCLKQILPRNIPAGGKCCFLVYCLKRILYNINSVICLDREIVAEVVLLLK